MSVLLWWSKRPIGTLDTVDDEKTGGGGMNGRSLDGQNIYTSKRR